MYIELHKLSSRVHNIRAHTEAHRLNCYLSTAVFTNYYCELMPYTALVNFYWISFYNAYQCQPINDNGNSCHITAAELV